MLVDTGVLYALVDPSDKHHQRAQRELGLLSNRDVLLAYPILLESYSLVLQRLGRAVAGRYLRETRDGFGLINVTAEDYQAGLELVGRYPDQTLSLLDAVLAVLSEHLDVTLWTFDRDFDMLRVPVWREGVE